MKRFMGVIATAVCLTLVGCGDSKEATSVMDGADKDAMAEYNKALMESQSAYSEAADAMEEAGLTDGGEGDAEE